MIEVIAQSIHFVFKAEQIRIGQLKPNIRCKVIKLFLSSKIMSLNRKIDIVVNGFIVSHILFDTKKKNATKYNGNKSDTFDCISKVVLNMCIKVARLRK